jgi:hypothetical protein
MTTTSNRERHTDPTRISLSDFNHKEHQGHEELTGHSFNRVFQNQHPEVDEQAQTKPVCFSAETATAPHGWGRTIQLGFVSLWSLCPLVRQVSLVDFIS